ncbi:MAG: Gfo/Idh/MocA family protein [Alphaproteobacteria bacterium]
MTDKSLNVALIGCGRVAGHHCRSISATDGVKLAAVCDLNAEMAKAYGDEFDVPWFRDYHAMLGEVDDIDIVAVITPSGMHFEQATEIMKAYGKHIIMEKPTFMRPDQVRDAYGMAAGLGLQLFPVFQNRYNKAVRRVKKALADGELGDIRIVSVRVRWCRPQRYYDMAAWRGTFSHDGGVIANQSIHHVDLLRYLCGDVARVSAQMRTLGADIEVEDTVVATFTYGGDAVGNLEVTTAARPDDFEASLSIVGSKGLAMIGGIAVNELQIFTPAPDDCAAHSEDFIGIKGHGAVYGHGHSEMYKDIVRHFTGDAPYPVDGEDCLGTIKLLHAFYRSDEAGGWVDVDSDEQSPRMGRANEEISALYRYPATGKES